MKRVKHAVLAIIAGTTLLSACQTMDLSGFGHSNGRQSLPPKGQSLAAPRANGAKLTLSKSDQGTTFQVKLGDRIAVNMVGVPTAGYQWDAVKLPASLTSVGRLSGPTLSDQMYPGYTGGNHWEVLVFDTTKVGTAKLRLEQRRPWETNEKPTDTFTATFEIIK